MERNSHKIPIPIPPDSNSQIELRAKSNVSNLQDLIEEEKEEEIEVELDGAT